MARDFTIVISLKDGHVRITLPRKFSLAGLLLAAGTLWERTIRILILRGVPVNEILNISDQLVIDAQNKVSTVTAMKLMKMIKENDDEHQTDQPEDSPV